MGSGPLCGNRNGSCNLADCFGEVMKHRILKLPAEVVLVLLVIGASMCGCGPIIGQFTGKRSKTVEVEAKYKLGPGNMVILVNSPMGIARSCGVRAVLSTELAREMESYGLAPTLISAYEVSSFRLNRPGFEELDAVQIGRELSAQQVLQVDITKFQLGTLEDESTGRGLIGGQVRVFDVEQNRQLWPEMELLGHEVMLRTEFREPETKDYRQVFTQDLCRRMSVKIVELFRKHRELRVPSGLK